MDRSLWLRAVVGRLLRLGWSPASIAGRLPGEYPEDQACRVPHEAIYQWVYAQPVSTLSRELIRLRTAGTARAGGRRPPLAPRIREPVYLHERPAEVAGEVRLVLVGGLPGTGESTVAGGVAEELGAVLLRSDRLRKELALLAPKVPAAAPY